MALILPETNPLGNVYSGKGEKAKRLNASYRFIIRSVYPAYHAATNDAQKREVAERVYQQIRSQGGSFFRCDGTKMSARASKTKIMKALKDARDRASKEARQRNQEILADCPRPRLGSIDEPSPPSRAEPPTMVCVPIESAGVDDPVWRDVGTPMIDDAGDNLASLVCLCDDAHENQPTLQEDLSSIEECAPLDVFSVDDADQLLLNDIATFFDLTAEV